MATTVHIPAKLLHALDRKAKALRVSRNRLIVRAVEQELSDQSAWPADFLAALRSVNEDDAAAVDGLVRQVIDTRRSKAPRAL